MIRPHLLALLCLLLVSCDAPPAASRATSVPAGATITPYFSPRGGCTDAIVAAIHQATTTIDVQAYSFTSAPIAQALCTARDQGVKIRVILDDSNRTDRYSSATFLHNQKVPVFIDDRHGIAHNKIILIDGNTIITGSFNFSKAAEESNAENVLILRGLPDLQAAYQRNFEAHLAHSQPYQP